MVKAVFFKQEPNLNKTNKNNPDIGVQISQWLEKEKSMGDVNISILKMKYNSACMGKSGRIVYSCLVLYNTQEIY